MVDLLQGDKTEKKKYEPPVPTRVGKKRKRVKVNISTVYVQGEPDVYVQTCIGLLYSVLGYIQYTVKG